MKIRPVVEELYTSIFGQFSTCLEFLKILIDQMDKNLEMMIGSNETEIN